MVRQRADERERRRVAVAVARRPEEPEHGVGLAGRLERLRRRAPRSSPAFTGGRPIRSAEPREPLQVLGEAERPRRRRRGSSRTRRGRAGAPRRRRAAPARPDRRRRGRRPRPRARLTARTASIGAPIAASSGAAFVHDSSISASGSESQTMPPPTQRWIRPVGDREGADRQRELEVAVAAHDAERAHRGAAADGLELGDQVDGGDLRRARDRASREGRREQLGQPDVLAQRPFDGRDEVRDAGELALDHQLRPAHRARLADAREVVPLQVDDHHVLGRVLLALRRARPSGRVPLIGLVHTRRPRRARKSSGEAETIAQPSPASVRGPNAASRAASAAGSPSNVALRCWTRLTW